jgi:hypothetical protein
MLVVIGVLTTVKLFQVYVVDRTTRRWLREIQRAASDDAVLPVAARRAGLVPGTSTPPGPRQPG